jgi:hypothetical protein
MTIRLSEEYKAQIDDIALRTGFKKSETARLAIKRFIESIHFVCSGLNLLPVMDYADATLVCLASESKTFDIATLDLRDFSVYRSIDNQMFTLLP